MERGFCCTPFLAFHIEGKKVPIPGHRKAQKDIPAKVISSAREDDAPMDDNTNRFTGGIDYTFHAWTFHYNLGYQMFTQNVSLNNVSSPELSINPVASSTKEPLTNLSQSEYRRLTTPISEFSFTGKPLSNLEWRGGYIYYRYQGPATLDQSYNGTAPEQFRRPCTLHGKPDSAG